MTNNLGKHSGIRDFGFEIIESVQRLTTRNSENLAYLGAKRDKLGQRLFDDPPAVGGEPGRATG